MATATPTKKSLLMTPDDMCGLIQIDIRTLRRWRHEGLVPAPIRIGSALRWRRSEVEAWVAAGMKPVKHPLTGKSIRRAAR